MPSQPRRTTSRRSAAAPSLPRSLADELRGWTDDALVGLLLARPDLAAPAAADITSLAARASTRASVHRALDRLDTPRLRTLEVVSALPQPTAVGAVAGAMRQSMAATTEHVAELRDLALLWGPDDDLHVLRTVQDALGPYPAGLGPPLDAPLDQPLEELLRQAPPPALDVLERLAPGPPVGAVNRADRTVERSSTNPLEWLLAHGLLAVADPGHVVLPLEVGLHLRSAAGEDETTPPPLQVRDRPPALVARAAGSAAAEVLRLVGELGDAWGLAPPPVLRSGGLGVRELRRTASLLDVDEALAAFVVELAYGSGLVADDGEVGPSWAPTPAFDVWSEGPAGQRWHHVAEWWLAGTRVAGLVGSRDDRGSVRNALSPDVDRALAHQVRVDVLTELATEAAGASVDPGSLLTRLHWRRPRRTGGRLGALYDDLVRWTLREAELLGVTGRGALSPPGRALIDQALGAPGAADPADVMAPLLPQPVDHVLLQADLTAVAPGPLVPDLARTMALIADVESRGGATVYRFTPDSVRRALDAGWTSSRLLDALARHSRTPVPQPLEYLVGDVARRHGQLRVGRASSYVQSDDPALLEQLLADRRCRRLRLRQLAPTVVAAQAEPTEVLETLRDVGLAPVAESPGGEVVITRPDLVRTPLREPPRPTASEPPRPTPAYLAAVVRSLRTGQQATDDEERRSAGKGPRLPVTDPSVTLALLRDAVASGSRVWIGYADATGRTERRVVDPLRIDGGRVTAFDHGTQGVRGFSVHRVTGVAPADGAHVDRPGENSA
ncbi:MAG TPA: helicase C-terminal domain-containing protein [Actinomycetales bacterium]|nr:helicase C-terminal domain-containing protein [Actinomycetales bacterium]